MNLPGYVDRTAAVLCRREEAALVWLEIPYRGRVGRVVGGVIYGREPESSGHVSKMRLESLGETSKQRWSRWDQGGWLRQAGGGTYVVAMMASEVGE